MVLVSYAVFSHVLHRKSLPLLPLPMFCSLILIKIPAAGFACGVPRVPCQSLVDSSCRRASGWQGAHLAFQFTPCVWAARGAPSQLLTLHILDNYCSGSASCACPGEAQLMSVLACSCSALLWGAAVPRGAAVTHGNTRGTAAKSRVLAPSACPPSAGFAVPPLFSAVQQLPDTARDLSGCCGWYLFHFQAVVGTSAADNMTGPVGMASSVSVPSI